MKYYEMLNTYKMENASFTNFANMMTIMAMIMLLLMMPL